MKTYSRKKSLEKCSQVYLDFGERCRLCFCATGDRQNLFDKLGGNPLPLKIKKCLSFEVCEDDGLPSGVCLTCLKLLDVFFEFQQSCEEVNNNLHDISKNFLDENVQTKILQQNLGESGRISFEDLLSSIGKNAERQEAVDSIDYSMDSLLNDCTNTVQIEEPLCEDSINISCTEDTTIKNSDAKGEEQSDNALSVENTEINTLQISDDSCVGYNSDDALVIVEESCSCDTLMSATSEVCNETSNNPDCSEQKSTDDSEESDNASTASTNLIFRCDKCPKRFAKWADLKRHSSVHNKQRGYECGVCEKWFPDKTSFKRHERIHTGERPYQCTHCKKSFSQISILTRHMSIHSGERPYTCEECNKTFRQKDGLRTHMRMHFPYVDEIFECFFCDKTFYYHSGLSRHLVSHTGRKFNCTMCARSFTDGSSLRRHSKTHKGENN